MVNWAGGPSVYLEVSAGADREAVRTCMRDWLTERRADKSWTEERCSIVWFAIDDDDGVLRVSDYHREAGGPPGSDRAPLPTLVDAALEGLAAAV